jgi:hypothetical protein
MRYLSAFRFISVYQGGLMLGATKLYQSIELAEPTADAGEASVQEIKRSWNLP